jgi:hypothetical protein
MKLKRKLNDLADQLYRSMGMISRPEFDYEKSPHPTERLMFDQACIAYEFFHGDSPDWENEDDEDDEEDC